MSKFLKYEKRLYEIEDRQASDMIQKIERGGRIQINGELLLAHKCEVIEGYPFNRDEYEIKAIQKNQQLQQPDYNTKDTTEDLARKKKLLAEMRLELAEKLNWKNKIARDYSQDPDWWAAKGKPASNTLPA